MSMLKSEIMDWLEGLEDSEEVYIDEDTLTLQAVNCDVCLDVGGFVVGDEEDDYGEDDYLQECEGGR